jgi:HAD superfamily hydrolase (TIGR01459 family)
MIKTKMPLPDLPKIVSGLSEVSGLYDGFILDLWGVVHDGLAPFPDTLPTLAALKKTGRKVWLLSNAPRRAYTIAEKLNEMGIAPTMYDGLLTSGEACWQAMREELIEKWGRRCLFIGSHARDRSTYEGLDLEIVTNPAQADFVLNTGIEDFSDTVDKYMPLLKSCILKNLPMLCANPDKIVHFGDKLVICAGALADSYALMQGEVVYYGKPYRDVYNRCLREMGTRRVLAVGDSMLTDIAGATGAGLDSVLVASGIHREEFSVENMENNDLNGFLANYLYRPNYIVKRFSW